MEKTENREKILGDRYETADTTIKRILKNTVGVRKVRTDKIKTTTNNEIKQAKEKKKTARKKFHQACKNGSSEEKQKIKIRYMESQKQLREVIGKVGAKSWKKSWKNKQHGQN